jgi:hypothetical protein
MLFFLAAQICFVGRLNGVFYFMSREKYCNDKTENMSESSDNLDNDSENKNRNLSDRVR